MCVLMLPSASSSMLILLSLTIRFFQITDYQIPTFFTRKLSLWIANSFFQNTDIMKFQQFLPEYWLDELPTVSSRILILWIANSFFQNTDIMNYQQFLPEYWHYKLPSFFQNTDIINCQVSSRILTLWITNRFFQNIAIITDYQPFRREYNFQNLSASYPSILWSRDKPLFSSKS